VTKFINIQCGSRNVVMYMLLGLWYRVIAVDMTWICSNSKGVL